MRQPGKSSRHRTSAELHPLSTVCIRPRTSSLDTLLWLPRWLRSRGWRLPTTPRTLPSPGLSQAGGLMGPAFASSAKPGHNGIEIGGLRMARCLNASGQSSGDAMRSARGKPTSPVASGWAICRDSGHIGCCLRPILQITLLISARAPWKQATFELPVAFLVSFLTALELPFCQGLRQPHRHHIRLPDHPLWSVDPSVPLATFLNHAERVGG